MMESSEKSGKIRKIFAKRMMQAFSKTINPVRLDKTFLESTIYCTVAFITPPARRAWRSYKFASLSFSGFFRCHKLGYRSWVIPLCILRSEPTSPRLLNSISSKLCHQNTKFNMHATHLNSKKVLRTKILPQNVL